MGFLDAYKGILGGGIFSKSSRNAAKNFLVGTPEEHEQISTLLPEQQPALQNLQAAANQGPGGAIGQAGNYYRNNLSDNPADFQAYAAPELRQFNEEIVPGLAEQFAGMGSGGLSSSGFRNAAVNAGTDLSERLGAIRANLRQNSAAGLERINQQALGNFSQDRMTEQGSSGFLSQMAPAIGTAAGGLIGSLGGPAGTVAGASIGGSLGSAFGGNAVGKNTSPYGNRY